MSYRTNLKQWWNIWGDHFMVIFLYVSTFAWMQLESWANGYNIPHINFSTTGLPMAVSIGFYVLKLVALEYRSMRDIEKDRKENPHHYEST